MSPRTRRDVLQLSGAALAGAIGLAGCTDTDGSGSADRHDNRGQGRNGQGRSSQDQQRRRATEQGSQQQQEGTTTNDGWRLAFVDDFSRGRLDTSKWSIGYGWGMTSDNKLEQIRPENVWVDGAQNHLVLEVTNEGGEYQSGAVNTKDKHYQQHGYWEASLLMPNAASGLLPAFWSKPNNEDWPPEIDFVEIVGDDHSAVHNVHYTQGSGKGNDEISSVSGSQLTQQFHTYACEWTPNYVRWGVDNREVGRTTAGSGTGDGKLNYGEPFYTMLNVHVWNTGWLGGSPDQNSYPQEFRCDWVRIWERV